MRPIAVFNLPKDIVMINAFLSPVLMLSSIRSMATSLDAPVEMMSMSYRAVSHGSIPQWSR